MKRLEWSVQITSSDLWLVTARGERKRNTINGRKKRHLSMEGRVRKRKREMTEETQTEEKENK